MRLIYFAFKYTSVYFVVVAFAGSVFLSQSANAASKGPKEVCISQLSKSEDESQFMASGGRVTSSYKISPQVQSFLKLLEVSLQNHFLSFDELRSWYEKALNSNVLTNPINRNVLTSTSKAYLIGFEKLISNEKLNMSNLLNEVNKMLAQHSLVNQMKVETKKATREIFHPHISQTINFNSKYSTKLKLIQLKDGNQFLAFGLSDETINLINLSDIEKPIKFDTKGELAFKSLFFTAKDGREFMAFGTLNGFLYLINMAVPNKIKEYKIFSHPIEDLQYFIKDDGTEMLSFGLRLDSLIVAKLSSLGAPETIYLNEARGSSEIITDNQNDNYIIYSPQPGFYLYVANIKYPNKIHKISSINGAIKNVRYYRNKSGDDNIYISTHDGFINIYNLKDLDNPIEIPVNSTISSDLYFFKMNDGREMCAFSTLYDTINIFDISSPNVIKSFKITDRQIMNVSAVTNFKHIVLNNDREYLAFIYNQVYYFTDLSDLSKNLIDLPPGANQVESFFSKLNGNRQVLMFGKDNVSGKRDANVSIIDFYLNPDQREVNK